MGVIVINTGTELLLGDVLNTHAAFIAREILPLGLRVVKQVTVPDGSAIRDAMASALKKAEIVFVTGGLGPTTRRRHARDRGRVARLSNSTNILRPPPRSQTGCAPAVSR